MAKARKTVSDLAALGCLSKGDLAWMNRVFDDKVGIVNSLLSRDELAGYGLHMYQCLAARTSGLFGNRRDVSSGGLGVSFDRRHAVLACFGEALERYCMTYTAHDGLVRARYAGLPPARRPVPLGLYDKAVYRSRKKEFADPAAQSVHWKELTHWTGRKKIFYPASLVFLPFDRELPVSETSSTGVAAHTDADKAILSGVLEIIERDATMVNFYQSLPRRAVSLDDLLHKSRLPRLRALLAKMLGKYAVRVFMQHTDTDVPVYLAYIWTGKGKKLHYGIGACADLDSDKAVLKALQECLFTYAYSFHLMDLRVTEKSRIKSLYEHFLYYQATDKFLDLVEGGTEVPYRTRRQTVAGLRASLRRNGLDVFYADLTTPDVRAHTPMRVVRVVIPGMIDLNKTHRLVRLGNERFFTLPARLGFKPRKKLNPEPHPFP